MYINGDLPLVPKPIKCFCRNPRYCLALYIMLASTDQINFENHLETKYYNLNNILDITIYTDLKTFKTFCSKNWSIISSHIMLNKNTILFIIIFIAFDLARQNYRVPPAYSTRRAMTFSSLWYQTRHIWMTGERCKIIRKLLVSLATCKESRFWLAQNLDK